MAIEGYITKIIVLETGLTSKQVRRVYDELRDENIVVTSRRKSRSLRGGSTLIVSQQTKIEASVLMGMYHSIGGNRIYTSIDLNSLHRAYQYYVAVQAEVKEISCVQKGKEPVFDLTDTWCLAHELRTNQAMLEKCRCGCVSFTSVNQRSSVDCPFCEKSLKGSVNQRDVPSLHLKNAQS